MATSSLSATSFRAVRASAVGAMVAVIVVVTLTLVGEMYEPLLKLLTSWFSHHWIGKSVLAVLAWALGFAATWAVSPKTTEAQAQTSLHMLVRLSVFGAVVLMVFFAWLALA